MVDSILSTKLYIPPTRPELVHRPRLIERLNEGLHGKLTLISAPAGFGKTTLVGEWAASCERIEPPVRVAWLSLDKGDNDPNRFLTYLVAALRTIMADMGEGVLDVLQSPQPPPTESIVTALLNEITCIPEDFIFVLDDYHEMDAQPVDHALTFLIEHLPPQMHLVVATREDPQLPLARLRARSQLTELRAADLRFTPAEAAEFLNHVMGLNLSAEDIAALETRTEGWIAGLQLAALSMRGRRDVTRFIAVFTGSHHFVMDYLVEEVLHQQPESVQTFLLHTSILDRLCGPLCDAVLHGDADLHPTLAVSGQKTLEYLEHANLLVVPLDDKRQWYRYHHLFADVLQARLMVAQPDQVSVLHRRASEWYEQNGLRSDAIHHALATEDFERAADLIEPAWSAMDRSFQSATWLSWVKALPDELVRTRPMLSVGYAWALLDGGEMEAAEARLRDVEWWLESTTDLNERPESPSSEIVIVDEEPFRTLPAIIAVARAYQAQALGDIPGTVKHARQALKLALEEDHLSRVQATMLLGFTYWASGDLEAAYRAMADWVDSMQKVGNIVFAIASTFLLADIRVAQGRLHEAVRTYKQSLQLAAEHDRHVQRVTANLYLGLAMLYHEMGDQEAAARHLLKSRELGEQTALNDWPYRWRLAQARLKETEGDLEAALDLLDEAERLYVRNPVPDTRPVEALRARVYVRQGRLTKALDWAHERGLSVDDEISYLREFEHITLVRILIAQYKSGHADCSILDAMRLLERLLQAAEEGRRPGSVIEILALHSLAHEAQGNIHLALTSLARALALAEPEGYIRLFVDEGPPMAELLREAAKRGIAPNYVSQLRAAFGKAKGGTPVNQLLSEPLSERELEVLQLVAQGLSNREISERLFLALDTVKGHNRRIYGKLHVQKRVEAVARARELGLL